MNDHVLILEIRDEGRHERMRELVSALRHRMDDRVLVIHAEPEITSLRPAVEISRHASFSTSLPMLSAPTYDPVAPPPLRGPDRPVRPPVVWREGRRR